MNWQLTLQWIFLIALMGFGVYTMWVIKNEKKTYLKNAREVHFKKFKLFVPRWWGEIPAGENELIFKRLDTRYDWEAHFIWFSEESPEKLQEDLIELFKSKIHERKILFDEETSIIYNPSDFREGALVGSGRYEMVRLEGTATQDRQERLYYDAFLIREKETGEYLYAESRSSILNGLVEGPYFEEVMVRLELVS